MKVRTLCSMMIALTGLMVFVADARADEPAPAAGATATPPPAAPTEPPPPTATAAAAPVAGSATNMRVALTLVPMPFLGTLKANFGGLGSSSTDAAFAFGVMPVFDYSVTSNFFVGFSPLITLNVKGKDQTTDASKEYDLMLRIGGNLPLADKVQAYGYLSPGYSIISPPQGDSAKGFVVGAHAGAMFDLLPNVFLNGELGYQLGFQSLDGNDLQTRFFQIGIGGGMRI